MKKHIREADHYHSQLFQIFFENNNELSHFMKFLTKIQDFSTAIANLKVQLMDSLQLQFSQGRAPTSVHQFPSKKKARSKPVRSLFPVGAPAYLYFLQWRHSNLPFLWHLSKFKKIKLVLLAFPQQNIYNFQDLRLKEYNLMFYTCVSI